MKYLKLFFLQVVDANGKSSAVKIVYYEIKQTKVQVISAMGATPTASDYLASASSSSITAAAKVTYKKGVVTEVEEVDMLTVHQYKLRM